MNKDKRIGVWAANKFLIFLQKYLYKDLDWIISQQGWKFEYKDKTITLIRPIMNDCLCRKCDCKLVCDHGINEPHRVSMCQNCAN